MKTKPTIAILQNPGNHFLFELADKLTLPCLAKITNDYQYYLTIIDDKLALIENHKNSQPLIIDFTSRKNFIRTNSSWRQELIARACGVKAGYRPSIIDATAGFGEDAIVLASIGCKVTMVERSSILIALLDDALQRLNKTISSPLDIELIHADSINYLTTCEFKPDVIYLDPMFPTRQKSALVKKKMRILRDLVSEDADSQTLFAIAKQRARKRLVVKRPKLAPTIDETKPDISFTGSSCRFDVYML